MDEPRTLLDMCDLLDFARDRQWSGQVNTRCHCHPEYADACPECHVLEREHGSHEQNDHEEGCRLAALITEAEAFIIAEQATLERR